MICRVFLVLALVCCTSCSQVYTPDQLRSKIVMSVEEFNNAPGSQILSLQCNGPTVEDKLTTLAEWSQEHPGQGITAVLVDKDLIFLLQMDEAARDSFSPGSMGFIDLSPVGAYDTHQVMFRTK